MIIEIVSFRLTEGVDENDFLAAHKEMHEKHVSKQPGFIDRTTYKGEDGVWKDVLHWETKDNHDEAGRIVMQTPEAQTWMPMMDPDSFDMYLGDPMTHF